MEEQGSHLVFVYGTLKRGEPNHHVLTETEGQQKIFGKGCTQHKYPLVIGSQYNIPYLLDNLNIGHVSFLLFNKN